MTVEYQAVGFEEYLVDRGLIASAKLGTLIQLREQSGDCLYPALRKLSLTDSRTLASALAEYHGLELVSDEQWSSLSFTTAPISLAFLRDNNVIPLAESDAGVLLAMADPSDTATIKALRLALGQPIVPLVAEEEHIQSAIERFVRDRPKLPLWQDGPRHCRSAGDRRGNP